MGKNYSADSPMTLKDRTLYAILYGLSYILSLLPFVVLYLLSDFVYFIIYHCAKYRRQIVRKNLLESFPEKTDAERLQIEKKFYHFFCDYIFETIKLTSMSREKIKQHVKYVGLNHIYDALKEGHSVALYLAHYCNWEWITSVGLHIPRDVLGGQIYHVLESKAFDTLMLTIRSRMGTENIPRFEAFRTMAKEYKKGRKMVIGFISDQAPEMHTIHHWVNFLNHDTAVITGTETIAKKLDFACVYFDIECKRRGYYVVNIIPLTMNSADYNDYEITEMYFKELEKTIRRQPEKWLWTHNRWKRTRKQYEDYILNHPNILR
jgi:KDO2-lipid IV(A) lauroyltransferase